MSTTFDLLTNALGRLVIGSPPRESVGVDIGCLGLNVVGLRSNHGLSKSLSLASWIDGLSWISRASVDFEHPIIEFGQADSTITTKKLCDQLRRALPRQIDSARRTVGAILPSTATVIRWPSNERPGDLIRSLRADLGSALKPDETIETCSWPIGNSGRKMVYAVSGGMTSGVAEILIQRGYRLPVVDSRPHSLARAVALDERRDSHIIIEWTMHDCSLVVANGPVDSQPGTVSLPRPLLCRPLFGYALPGGDRDAESQQGRTLSRRTGERNRTNMKPIITSLAEDIRRTLRSVDLLGGIDTSGSILLCGAAATIPGTADGLAEALGVEVRKWRWGGGDRPTAHASAPDDVLFAASLGAACGIIFAEGD